VKTWRRLQQIGAVAIRNAVYVLPNSPQSREDFEWLKAEILANHGEATVFAAETIDSLAHDDIVAAFRADRERLFENIRDDVSGLSRKAAQTGAMRGTELRGLQRAMRHLRDRFAQVVTTDFFGASGRQEALQALAELERRVAGPVTGCAEASHPGDAVLRSEDYRGRTWLTRPRPGVDRAGSAWLIRRFIDPQARFVFAERPRTPSKAVPFDMYDVEFSHRGGQCTFEVLSERFGIADASAAQLGRLVHDVDLKEHRYNVPETGAIGRLIDGLRQVFSRDEELLEHGIVVFEALYRSFAGTLAAADAEGRVQGRGRHRKKGREV